MSRLDAGLEETERLAAARDTSHWQDLITRLIDDCHPEQRDFVLDPSRHITVLCNRGAGKTIGGMVRFIRRMLTTPQANCFYLAKFREHAERLMWLPLKGCLAKLGFIEDRDVVYNETKLRCTIVKNGATLQLFGADKPGYIEALRGQSYHEVGIDEASIHPDRILMILRHEIIGPRLLGAFWLAGTPGRTLKGIFYEASRRGSKIARLWKERDQFPDWKGWSLHKWSLKSAIEATKDRPIKALLEIFAAQLDEMAGMSEDNPIRRRELDGEWAADDTINVYRYRIHITGEDAVARGVPDGSLWNQWDPPRIAPYGLAEMPSTFSDWAHVIAIDLGFSDPTAINVFAFSPSDPTRTIYHRLCFEQKGLHAQPIAHKLIGEDLNHEDPGGIIGAIGGWPNGMVADSAHQMGAMILAELAKVYGVAIEAAVKGFKYKIGAIEVVNGDLVDGRIKILKGSRLEDQLVDLQWAESRNGDPMERKDQPNDSCDTLVYARAVISRLITAGSVAPEDHVPKPGDRDYTPPLPSDNADDYSHLMQDDYQSLLG